MFRIWPLFIIALLIETGCSSFPEVLDYREGTSTDSIAVIHISDLHFGRYRRVHERTIRIINEIQPDIVVITGDAVNANEGLEALRQFLSLIPESVLTAAVPGNWEYGEMRSIDELISLYDEFAVDYLVNESIEIDKGEYRLRISGLDDYIFGNPDYSIIDASLDYPEIILIHEPAGFAAIPASKPSKTVLAGHTHGGQITFFGIPLYLPPASDGYSKGLYEEDGKRLFVSKGLGSGLINLRVFARPDIMVYSFK